MQLPLCAAENIMSDYVKLPLSTSLQEKYLLGSAYTYNDFNNFLGSEKLFPLYDIIRKECRELFNSKYAEARTLSGLNAVLTLLMSLFNIGDRLLISSVECGGHSSLELFCKRLGLTTEYLPYDYELLDFDYEKSNQLLQSGNYAGLVVCLSDIAFEPKVSRFNLPKGCVFIYDVTQTLGLIAGGVLINPFDCFSDDQDVILLGATHKTLPGPTCGLIMTRNHDLFLKFDTKINPDYLRNIQLHQVASLILTLAEFYEYGRDYSLAIVNNANVLGQCLTDYGFDVIHKNKLYSQTHQLFLSLSKKTILPEMCSKYGISLNFRDKPIYKGRGVRIGVQEITRYGYGKEEIEQIAMILNHISQQDQDEHDYIEAINNLVRKKHLSYCFDDESYLLLENFLHDNKF